MRRISAACSVCNHFLLVYVLLGTFASTILPVMSSPLPDRHFVYSARTTGEIWSAPLFAADGSFVIFASLDRSIRKVTLPTERAPNVSVAWVITEVGPVRGSLRFSRDEAMFFSVTLFGNVFCRRVADGEVVWSHNVSVPAWIFTPTLATEQNWLLVGSREGELLFLDAANGHRVHVLKEGAGIWAEPIVFAVSPGAFGDQVSNDRIVAYGVTAGAIVKAASFSSTKLLDPLQPRWTYDLVPGATHWKQRTRSWIFGAPAVTQAGSRSPRVVFGSGNHHIYSVSAVDGKLVWSKGVPGGISSQPAVVKSRSSGEENLVGVTEHGWVVCFNELAGEPRWNKSLGQGVSPSVSLTVVERARLVVIGTTGGRLFGLRSDDGSEVFHEEIRSCEVKAKISAHFAPKSQVLRLAVGCKQGSIHVITLDGIFDFGDGDEPSVAPIDISVDVAAQAARSPQVEAMGTTSDATEKGRRASSSGITRGEEDVIGVDSMSLAYPLAVAACGAAVIAAVGLWWRRHSTKTMSCTKRL